MNAFGKLLGLTTIILFSRMVLAEVPSSAAIITIRAERVHLGLREQVALILGAKESTITMNSNFMDAEPTKTQSKIRIGLFRRKTDTLINEYRLELLQLHSRQTRAVPITIKLKAEVLKTPEPENRGVHFYMNELEVDPTSEEATEIKMLLTRASSQKFLDESVAQNALSATVRDPKVFLQPSDLKRVGNLASDAKKLQPLQCSSRNTSGGWRCESPDFGVLYY